MLVLSQVRQEAVAATKERRDSGLVPRDALGRGERFFGAALGEMSGWRMEELRVVVRLYAGRGARNRSTIQRDPEVPCDQDPGCEDMDDIKENLTSV